MTKVNAINSLYKVQCWPVLLSIQSLFYTLTKQGPVDGGICKIAIYLFI